MAQIIGSSKHNYSSHFQCNPETTDVCFRFSALVVAINMSKNLGLYKMCRLTVVDLGKGKVKELYWWNTFFNFPTLSQTITIKNRTSQVWPIHYSLYSLVILWDVTITNESRLLSRFPWVHDATLPDMYIVLLGIAFSFDDLNPLFTAQCRGTIKFQHGVRTKDW